MTQVVTKNISAGALEASSESAVEAVRRLLLEDHRQVFRYLVRQTGAVEDAREVWQCFALRALGRSSDLRDPRAVLTWLSRVLATTLADHRRGLSRMRRHEVAIDGFDADDRVFAYDVALSGDETPCQCIHDVIRSLRPDYADIVWRADLLSEPREEIAASLNTTVNNIGVRLHRGRAALRRCLEHACGGCVDQAVFECGCPAVGNDMGSPAIRHSAPAGV